MPSGRPPYSGPPRTELERFARRVGKRQTDVANETGIPISTVSRLFAGEIRTPSSFVYLRLERWALATAREQRIPMAERWALEEVVQERPPFLAAAGSPR